MSKLDIPESWAETKLDTVANKITDGSHNPPKAVNTGLPMLSCRNIKDGVLVFDNFRYISKSEFERENQRTLVKEGDLLLSIVGTIGATAIVKKEYLPFTLQRSVAVIGFDKCIVPEFARFFLCSMAGIKYLNDNSAGSTQKGIYLKSLRAMEIPVPPLGEQKRIVAKIEATQEKIKTIEQSVTKAEELIGKYREALLQKAFRGELVPQDPNDEPASKLLERIRADRAKQTDGKKKKKDDLPPIKPEEIPFDIPKSWEWVRIGDLFSDSMLGLVRSAEEQSDTSPYLYLKMGDYNENGDIFYSQIAKVKASASEVVTYKLRSGDFVFNTRNSVKLVGKVTIIDDSVPDNLLFNNNLMRIRFDKIDPRFIFWQFQSNVIKDQLSKIKSGTTSVAAIYARDLVNVIVALPPMAEQKRILKHLSSAIEGTKVTTASLSELRGFTKLVCDSILASAFSGRLVPQNPLEGTGHELLEKIKQTTQAELVPKPSQLTAKDKAKKKTRTKK